MPAQVLTAIQESTLAGMIDVGLYQSKSEAMRASVAALVAQMPPAQRLSVAMSVYRNKETSISGAAMIAGIAYREMHDRLHDEGILRLGFTNPDDSIKAGKKLAKLMRKRE